MSAPHSQPAPSRTAFDASRFDFSLLVGRTLSLYSEQFPGRELSSKVVLANDREITIDRGGGSGLIDNLVNNQKVTIRVKYKSQDLAIPAILKRSAGGMCQVILGEKVMPLLRRRFTRVALTCPVKLAAVPVATFDPAKLARLRWVKTHTCNFSSGGSLIESNSCLESPTYLFMKLSLKDFPFPSLVLAQVRYALPNDNRQY